MQQIAPGEVQLWRLANIGADIWYNLALEGQTFTVIGEDGNPVWEVFDATELLLPPGKRFEVLVIGPDAGDYVLQTLKYNQQGDVYPETDLLTLRSEGAAVATPALPTSLRAVDEIPESEVVERRTMVFSEEDAANKFFINDKQFDENRVDVQPKLGTTEEWTLRNTSTEQHPFHIHVNDFQVDLGRRRAVRRARRAGHGAAATGQGRRDPHAVHGLPRQVRVPLPHPQPRGQRHDGGGRSRRVTCGVTSRDATACRCGHRRRDTPRPGGSALRPASKLIAEAGHVEPPDAGAARTDIGDRGVPVRLEVAHPLPEREVVVLAQALDVPHLEARSLHLRNHRADLVQFAVGEHVAVDEAVTTGSATGARVAGRCRG